MKNNNFRSSDSDFASYLFSLGYRPMFIEVKKDSKEKYKAFIHFKENKDLLTDLENKYNSQKIEINLKQYSLARKEINRLVNSAIRLFKRSVEE